MRESTRTAGLLIVLGVTALAEGAFGQVTHEPKQERVPDFGLLVPERPAAASLPYEPVLERVTTAVPWGRGMEIVDGDLVILSRGRHRSDGGVPEDLVDHAGTLWRVDPSISEPVVPGQPAGEAVRRNATALARPTSPPFSLYQHGTPAQDDILMGRPYCALAYDAASRNLFVCAFSGAELPTGFRKHATDAVFRYDLRSSTWHVVEQHDPKVVPAEALGTVISNEYYPHHDPAVNPPPHGWTNGPDGCAVAGAFLYVPAKDNHVLVQYDLDGIRRSPDAAPPDSRVVLRETMILQHPGGEQGVEVLGPSAVAVHEDWLYVGFRTSSVVVRIPLDETGDLVRRPDGRVAGQLIGVFEPWDAERRRSGNLYDIDVSGDGVLFVSMGTEGRVWRVEVDPDRPFYGNDQTARPTTTPPFLDMSRELGKKAGSNNILVDRESGHLYVSSRSNDTGEGRLRGTIYRVKLRGR